MSRWATLTVTDKTGRRYSLDVNAASSYDAAHLYLTHVVRHPGCGLPKPTVATTFEIITGDTIIRVQGVKLKSWIERRRMDLQGLRGLLFFQRPMLE